MRRLIFCSILLLGACDVVDAEELWLKIGEVKSLAAPPGQKVQVGARGIIKVIDDEKNVRLVGLKNGTTPLVIGQKNYFVHVTLSTQKEFVAALRARMQVMMGLKINADTNPVAVEGTLLRFSDWRALAELSRRFQGEY